MEHTKTSPRDFFLYVLSNISLYYCVIWLITLWWQIIDRWFPSVQSGMSYASAGIPSEMRWALASLIIVFPVYILVTRFLNNDLAKHPEKKDLRIRRWLMYLTLSLAAVAVVIDLVTLLFNLLEGDFAAAFILKVLAVLVVSLMVFGYYFYELRRETEHWAPARQWFRWGSAAIVLVSIVSSFFVVGSPIKARMIRYDQQRISDLQSIQWQVTAFWQNKGRLPSALAELNDPITGYMVPRDPEGAEGAYEYRAVGERVFEICATFSRQSTDNTTGEVMPITGAGNEYWIHGAGRTCFNRTIDPQTFPVKPSAY